MTYETVLEVDNSDLLLRPGMTATAEIVTTSIEDAVLVPNAALRFTPAGRTDARRAAQRTSKAAPCRALMPQMRRRPGAAGGQQGAARRMGRVWILEDGAPALVVFRPGASDGRMTQVLDHGPCVQTSKRRLRTMNSSARRSRASSSPA